MNGTRRVQAWSPLPCLREGDAVAIAAPAGAMRPEHLDLLDRGTALLRDLGLRPIVDEEVYRRHLYMAGEDQERAGHLMSLFSNPEIKGIMALRGGYGSLRLLPLLDPSVLREHPKVFVGMSDITVLHAYLLQVIGKVTYYGPHLASPSFCQGKGSLTVESFRKALMLREPLGRVACTPLRRGVARGPLVGGCLSNLVTLIGTPFQPNTEGCVLFLEDVGEAPYRIDRMLTHMRAAGLFRGIQGILFGEMMGCDAEGGEEGLLWRAVDDALQGLSVPVLRDFPAGHGRDCLTLPLGLEVILDGDEGMAFFPDPPTGP